MFDVSTDRAQRFRLRLDVSVARRGTGVRPAVLTNLSLDGCCVTGPFCVGERVRIRVPGMGALDAQIRWATHDRAGARFVDERASLEYPRMGTGGHQ